MKEKISFFYKQPNQLNDVIRRLHIIIDFLKSSGCSKNTKIFDYALNTLKMSYKEDSSSNKQVFNQSDWRFFLKIT
jgi:hypothetical protein